MGKIRWAVILLTILLIPSVVLAKESTSQISNFQINTQVGILARNGEQEIKIEQKDQRGDRDEEVENQLKVEIKGNEFEIIGRIDAISANMITVAGQSITIDPTRVREFEQKGVLKVGQLVKVEGIIQNNVKLAREIKVLGVAQPSGSPTPSPTSSPSTPPGADQATKDLLTQIRDLLNRILQLLQNLFRR